MAPALASSKSTAAGRHRRKNASLTDRGACFRKRALYLQPFAEVAAFETAAKVFERSHGAATCGRRFTTVKGAAGQELAAANRPRGPDLQFASAMRASAEHLKRNAHFEFGNWDGFPAKRTR